MKFTESPLVKISMRNGLIAGLLGFVLLLALYFMGKHPFLFPVFFDFRIFLFGIFLVITLREVRDIHQEGILFFWQGMISSLLFTIIFALVTAILIWSYVLINPNFLSNYITTALEQIKSIPADAIEQIGKETYERNLKALPSTNGYDLAFHYFWQSFVISFFVSIIISVILRRQPKND
jgi:hypothetical protein